MLSLSCILTYIAYFTELTASSGQKPVLYIQILSATYNYCSHLMATPARLLLMLALILLTTATTYQYYKQSSDALSRSSFWLDYAAANEVVTAQINIYDSAPAYIVQLWAPGNYYPSTPSQTSSLVGSALYQSLPLAETGRWRLTVLPLSLSISQTFRFSIVIRIGSLSLGSYMDVARYQRMFTIYHSLPGTQEIRVVAPTGFESAVSLKLYGPFSQLTVSGNGVGDKVGTATSTGSQLTYSNNGREFYYIVVEAADTLMSSRQLIKVTYNSDQFECPFAQSERDYNSVFQGCTHLMPTVDFPCVDFDGITCKECAPEYDITSYGRCQFKINCPADFYFRFGNCLPKLPNCADFESIGGKCNLCDTGFELIQTDTFQQLCSPIVVQNDCGQNRYRRGDTCFSYVDNCADFEMSVGVCRSCQAGYRQVDNQCLQVPSTLNCYIGFVEVNGACVEKDEYCVFFNQNNVCEVCATGYKVDGAELKCTRINCPDRYYPRMGECVPVSGTCGTYDPFYGHCLTCVIFHYLFNNTICKQVLPGAVGQATEEQPCPQFFYRREGTCVRVNELCGTYNVDTGLCTSCVNSTYYLRSGQCKSIIEFCGYRTYFADGGCLPVSPLCDNYDPTTGWCETCRDGTRLNNQGRCLFNFTCGEREYYAFDGSCQPVSELCGEFNPNTGECVTCSADYDLNEAVGTTKKWCCFSKNYLLNDGCDAFLRENCAQNHERFGYCLQCRPGYERLSTPTEGLLVFSKCRPISP